jgi:hypothetical protein
MTFVAIKIGRRQGARSGAYLDRYVTIPQARDGRRPIFIATLRAAAGLLFSSAAANPYVSRSDMLVVSASAARTALKNSRLTGGESHAISRTGH